MSPEPAEQYRRSGVDIDEAELAVELIRNDVRSTFGPKVISDVGNFGAMYLAEFPGVDRPVLVASTDGVGTKLRVAAMAGDYSTVGNDLINHCVNDILVQGAAPLFFQDYIACGRLEAGCVASIVKGLAAGCRENGFSLIGGEIAEMPGFYQVGDYDVAGTIVGVADRDRIVDGSAIAPGDVLLGCASNGLHTNGYSLARRVLFEEAGLDLGDSPEELDGATVAESLLRVHRSYLHPVMPCVSAGLARGICHVTGGGLPGNLQRILPDELGAAIEPDWSRPGIFELIARIGEVPDAEMYRVFNMGIGLVVVVSPGDEDRAIEIMQRHEEGLHVWRIGVVTERKGVRIGVGL